MSRSTYISAIPSWWSSWSWRSWSSSGTWSLSNTVHQNQVFTHEWFLFSHVSNVLKYKKVRCMTAVILLQRLRPNCDFLIPSILSEGGEGKMKHFNKISSSPGCSLSEQRCHCCCGPQISCPHSTG